METIAKQLTEHFILSGEIPEEKREIIQYGLEISLSTLMVFISILLVSAGLFCNFDGVIFTWFFLTIRLFSGGFHATTHKRCYVCSLMAFVCTAICAKLLPVESFWVQWIGVSICYVWIYSKAPHINPNHPISEAAAQSNKRKLKQVMLVNFILFSVILWKLPHYGIVAFYTTVLVGVMLWITENNGKNYVKILVKR